MKVKDFLDRLDGFDFDVMNRGFVFEGKSIYRFFEVDSSGKLLLCNIMDGQPVSLSGFVNQSNKKTSAQLLDYFNTNGELWEDWRISDDNFETLLNTGYALDQITTPVDEFTHKSNLVDLNNLYIKSTDGEIYRFIYNQTTAEFWNITTGKSTKKAISVNSNGLTSLAEIKDFFRRYPVWANWEAAATLKELL